MQATQAKQAKQNPTFRMAMVGRTGSGKTTLINMITNLILNKRYNDKREIAITQSITFDKDGENANVNASQKVQVTEILNCTIDEFKNKQSENLKGGQKESQTKTCNYYSYSTQDYDLILIDTPGVGDTNGMMQDEKNLKEIVHAVDAMGQIHGLILVHKESDVRLDASTKYMVQEIRGILAKGYEDNIIVMFTHASNNKRAEAIDALKEMKIPTKMTFNFENGCFVPPELVNKYMTDTDDQDSYHLKAQMNWISNHKTFNRFKDDMYKLQPKDATQLKNLHTKKTVLYQAGFKLADMVSQLNSIEVVFMEQLNNIQKFKDVMKQTQNYNYVENEQVAKQVNRKVPKIVKKMVPNQVKKVTWNNSTIPNEIPRTDDKCTTVCLSCHSNCHNPCYLEFITTDGAPSFSRCYAFGGSGQQCNVCNHDTTTHAHRRFTFQMQTQSLPVEEWETVMEEQEFTEWVDSTDTVYDTVAVQKVNQQMKQRYEDAEQQLSQANHDLDKIKVAKDNLEKYRTSYLKMIAHLFKAINEVSMCPINDYFEEYIKVHKQEVKNNKELTTDEKQKKSDQLDRLLNAYTLLKASASSGAAITLTPEESTKLQNLIKEVEAQDDHMTKYYAKLQNKALSEIVRAKS